MESSGNAFTNLLYCAIAVVTSPACWADRAYRNAESESVVSALKSRPYVFSTFVAACCASETNCWYSDDWVGVVEATALWIGSVSAWPSGLEDVGPNPCASGEVGWVGCACCAAWL